MVASLAVAASCTAGSDDAERVRTTVAAGTSATAEPTALDVTAPAVGGGEVDLGTYAGRDLALWFWAPY